MRIRVALLVACAAVAFALPVASAPAGSASPTANAAAKTVAKRAAKRTFVYAYRSSPSPAVLAYAWESDGTLTPIAGSPFSPDVDPVGCGGFCGLLGYSKRRNALVMPGSDALNVYLVGADGVLTLAPGSPFAVEGVGNRLFGTRAVDRGSRTFVYTSDYTRDTIRGYEMAADGSLSVLPGSPVASGGDGPDGLAATSRQLLCIHEVGGLIASFAVGKDGALTPAPGALGDMDTDGAWNLHVDARGRRVYAGDGDGPLVHGFSIDRKTGELRPLKGSPYTATLGSAGSGANFAKKGPAVLFGVRSEGIQSATVARNGAIEPLPDTVETSLTRIQAHGRSPDGKYVVVAGDGDQGVGFYTFALDKKTGALTPVDFVADATTGVSGLQVVRR